MIQKIIKVGNSLAVTLPAEFVKKADFKAGGKIEVETDVDSGMILLKKDENTATAGLTPEFADWLSKTAEKNSKLIKRLANV